MRVSATIVKLGLCVFVATFSTVAVAQRLMGEEGSVSQQANTRRGIEIREIPVFFPQGRLYCADGSLAYQKLYPQGWQRISSEDAVRIASQSVDDACLGGDPHLCKEYRARLSKLRLAIRGCFKVTAS
jgi:hypothetical protein